jgi:hypothetical protein
MIYRKGTYYPIQKRLNKGIILNGDEKQKRGEWF